MAAEQPSLSPTQQPPLSTVAPSRATAAENATALVETARVEYAELQARARARQDHTRLLEDAARYCAAGTPGVDEIRPFIEQQQQQREQKLGRKGLADEKQLLRLMPREPRDPQRNMLFETGVFQCLKPAKGAAEDRYLIENSGLATGRRQRGPLIPPPSVKTSGLMTPFNGTDEELEFELSALKNTSSRLDETSLVVPKNLAHRFGRRTCERLLTDYSLSSADSPPFPPQFPPIDEHSSVVGGNGASRFTRERRRELLAPPTSTARRTHTDPRAHPLHALAPGEHRLRRDEFAAWKEALYVSDNLFKEMDIPTGADKAERKRNE